MLTYAIVIVIAVLIIANIISFVHKKLYPPCMTPVDEYFNNARKISLDGCTMGDESYYNIKPKIKQDSKHNPDMIFGINTGVDVGDNYENDNSDDNKNNKDTLNEDKNKDQDELIKAMAKILSDNPGQRSDEQKTDVSGQGDVKLALFDTDMEKRVTNIHSVGKKYRSKLPSQLRNMAMQTDGYRPRDSKW